MISTSGMYDRGSNNYKTDYQNKKIIKTVYYDKVLQYHSTEIYNMGYTEGIEKKMSAMIV